jgi:hypothetical protein
MPFRRLNMDAFPNRDSVELLRTLGVRYVLVHTNDYSNFEEINRRILEQGLHASVSMGGIQVYELELGHSEP